MKLSPMHALLQVPRAELMEESGVPQVSSAMLFCVNTKQLPH